MGFLSSVLVCCLVAAPVDGNGLSLEVYNNTALAYQAASSTVVESIAGPIQAPSELFSAQWTGLFTVPETANYNFSCSFEGGYGLLWVDDHLWCNHGMPRYAKGVGPSYKTLTTNQSYPIRAQFYHNESNASDMPPSLDIKWFNNKSIKEPSAIPAENLSPSLPKADEWRIKTQKALTNGWGSFYSHNLLAVTRLPDQFQIKIGLCQLSSGACEYDTVDSANSVRLGHHAFDNSYVQYYHWWAGGGGHWDGGVNVSVSWSSQPSSSEPASSADDLTLVVEGVSATNWSNYVLVLVPEFCVKYSGTGTVAVDGPTNQIVATPVGLPPTTITATGAPQYTGPQLPGLGKAAHLVYKLDSSKGGSVALPLVGVTTRGVKSEVGVDISKDAASPAEQMKAQLQDMRKKEEATYAKYGDLADTAAAVQSSVMWLVVFEQYVGGGLVLTISRGSMGGGDTMCDWDNFFAAYMLGLDEGGKALAFATFAEQMKYRTTLGFVPNCGQNVAKARDRTEPVVGAKVLREFVKRYSNGNAVDPDLQSLVELLFNDIFIWHDWFWQHRRLSPLNLIAVGSDPNPSAVKPSGEPVCSLCSIFCGAT
jgi:hypothetical protein